MALTQVSDAGLVKPAGDLQDNEKIIIGTGNDLEIYHDGTNSIINGALRFTSGDVYFRGSDTYNRGWTWDTSTEEIRIEDQVELCLGNAQDLKIYHNGSHSYIDENGAGILAIRSNGTEVAIASVSGESMGRFINDGAVELYYDGSKKFETMNAGVTVAGYVSATGDNGYAYICNDSLKSSWGTGLDLNIYHDGSNSFIQNSTGEIRTNDTWRWDDSAKATFGYSNDIQIYHDGSYSYIDNTHSGGLWIRGGTSTYQIGIQAKNSENSILCTGDGSVELYYDNSKKLETWSGGVTATGGVYSNETSGTSFKAEDGGKFIAGGGNDLEIYHDGSNSNIQNNTSDLFIRSNSSGDKGVVVRSGAAVDLYYDNSKKLETTSYGTLVTGRLTTTGNITAPDNGHIQLGDGLDLDIYHGSDLSYITNSTGKFFIKNTASTSGATIEFQTAMGLDITKGGSENMALFKPDGAVELYYDNTKRFETTNTGTRTYGHNNGVCIWADVDDSSYTNTVVNVECDRNTTDETYSFFGAHRSGNASVFFVRDSGNVENANNSYGSTSDERLKENIVDAGSQWDDIKNLKVRKFNFKETTDPNKKTMIGLVAQEAEKVSPGLVSESKSMQGGVEGTYKTVKYSILYMKAIKALQEAISKIEALETKVAALEGG